MKTRSTIFPNDEVNFKQWYNIFVGQFALQAATLQMSGDLPALEADLAFLNYVMDSNDLKSHNLGESVGVKNLLLDGVDDGAPLSYPGAPVLATPAPAGVPAGLLGRLNDLIVRIRRAKAYTEAIGIALGIHKTPPDAVTAADLAALVPVISVVLSGMKALIRWTRARGTDGLRIEANYGPSWGAIIDDSRPDHLDNHPLPPPGQAEVWRYRAIYLRDGVPVGSYSTIHAVTVTGA